MDGFHVGESWCDYWGLPRRVQAPEWIPDRRASLIKFELAVDESAIRLKKILFPLDPKEPMPPLNTDFPTYPKSFINAARLGRERDRVFIAMPFEAHHSEPLWKVIHGVCEIRGLNLRRADTSVYPNPIVADILDEIERAEIIIADLTELNPNVLYELGIAHVRCDSVILLCQKGQQLPFDLASIRCIFFDLNRLDGKGNVDLSERLGKALDALRSVGPPVILDGALERTRQIVRDMQSLLNNSDEFLKKQMVWFSGFLSSFAICDDEPLEPGEEEYRVSILEEKESLLMLARRGCQIRCIITPPGNSDLIPATAHYARLRVKCLFEFITSSDPALNNIDWVVSPFRQKNFYIIGHSAYFEGYKKGMGRGYNLTLRQTGVDAVNANIALWQTLYDRLASDLVPGYVNLSANAQRKALRDVTARRLEESRGFLDGIGDCQS